MIIDDLNAFRDAFPPGETDTPLTINANAVLALPVAGRRLEPVTRYRCHGIQACGIVKHPEFPQR
jgi:hypothetical protein